MLGRFSDVTLLFSFLSGFVAALVLFALIGRAQGFLVPFFRLIGRPFRPLRRLLPRRSFLNVARRGQLKQAAAEGAVVAKSGTIYQTEIEDALQAPEDAAPQTPHDFREEEKILERSGWYFRSIRVPAEYLPDHLVGPLTDEIEALYVGEAKKFFSMQVSLEANPKSLYEDVDGAFAVTLFRSIDRRCYYVLNEMRKTINDNARRLILLLTFILYAWAIYALWEFTNITMIYVKNRTGMALDQSALHLAGPALAFAIALLLIFVFHTTGYRQQQQHSSREMRFFLTKYLGRIADRYREATGNAKQVTVGDETNSEHLAEAAKKWHKTMVWIPFRTFFIECFVRNVRYQINRNCGYYLWIPPVAVVVLLAALAYFVAPSAQRLVGTPGIGAAYLMCGGVLAMMMAILLYFYFDRINAVVLKQEMSHLDWLGFENLNVSAVMDEVVGKYAEDIGFWKRRMPRM